MTKHGVLVPLQAIFLGVLNHGTKKWLLVGSAVLCLMAGGILALILWNPGEVEPPGGAIAAEYVDIMVGRHIERSVVDAFVTGVSKNQDVLKELGQPLAKKKRDDGEEWVYGYRKRLFGALTKKNGELLRPPEVYGDYLVRYAFRFDEDGILSRVSTTCKDRLVPDRRIRPCP
jgi:hypothetical protein